MDKALTGINTPGQSRPEINVSEEVFHIPQNSRTLDGLET